MGNSPPLEEENVPTPSLQNEVIEKIASNDAYNLSFVQIKTADDIRRQFLQRMSKEGV